MNNHYPHRRYLKNFIIDRKLQTNLIVPIVILSVTLVAALDALYYLVFFIFLKFWDQAHGSDFSVLGILVHMAIVSIIITLISIAAISAALIVQTHQILGPLIPIAKHIRKLINGNYSDDLVIRKDDRLHELVKDLNELTRQLRMNNNGQSIIGALVGIAIAGISMMVVVTGLQFAQQGQNQVKYIMDLDNFNEEIRGLLSDPAACTNSFVGKVASAGQSYSISNLYDGTTSPGAVRYTVGSVYGDSSLNLNSMTLSNFMAGATSLKGQMTLVIDVNSQKVSLGGCRSGFVFWRKHECTRPACFF